MPNARLPQRPSNSSNPEQLLREHHAITKLRHQPKLQSSRNFMRIMLGINRYKISWSFNLCLLFELCSSAVLRDFTSPSSLHIFDSNVSSTLNYEPDPRFTIRPISYGAPIDKTSCFISTIQYLVQQTQLNFNGNVRWSSWTSSDPRYSSVKISITPGTGAVTVDRHFLIWGLAKGAYFMLPNEGINFVAFKFVLLWEGQNVGEIHFARSSDVQQTIAGNRSLELKESTQSSSLSTPPSNDFEQTPNLTSTGLPDASNDDVKIFCRLGGYDLEPNDVYRVIISALTSIAPVPATQLIPRFRTEADYGSLRINFERPHPIRRYPPFFEATHAIKALGALPQFMLDRGLFSEVDVRIEVSNALVSEGEMALRRRPHVNGQ